MGALCCVGVGADDADAVRVFLESLPPEPPAGGWAARSPVSLPPVESILERARELAGSHLGSRPFLVFGAWIPREATFLAPPEPGEVRYLLPLLVIRNPAQPSNNLALYYSVYSDLADGRRKLPRSVVELTVLALPSLRQTAGEGVLVLGPDELAALLWIGVRGQAWADEKGVWYPAGRYQGRLVTSPDGTGPDIEFAVTLMPYTKISAPDDRLAFVALQPGYHEAQLRVTYQANVEAWRLKVEVAQEPERQASGDRLPLARLAYALVPEPDNGHRAWLPVPEYGWWLPAPVIGNRAEYRLAFRLQTTWGDAAGSYEGRLRLTVEPEER